mgnify:CR=1 FL=1
MSNSSNNPIGIPEISDEELRRRADKIKPLVYRDGALHFIQEPNLRGTAFMWDPALNGKAPEMREVARITTYHAYGYPAFLPTIAEVLTQIPENLVGSITAFEVYGLGAHTNDLHMERKARNAGFLVAETILYA